MDPASQLPDPPPSVIPPAPSEIPETPAPPVIPPTPVSATPETPPTNPVTVIKTDPQIVTAAAKKSGGLKVFFILLSVLLFVVLGSFTAAYLVATEKIPAPNQQTKQFASNAIFSLPFIPKTPTFIVEAYVSNPAKVEKSSFDLSLALASNDFTSIAGTSNFDFRISGYTDISDPQKPLADIRLELQNLLDAKLKTTADKAYVKVDKLPPFIYLFIGLTPEQVEPVFSDWISYDISTLDSEARRLINSTPDTNQNQIDQAAMDAFKQIFTKDVMPYLKLTEESLGEIKTYKLEFVPTAIQLDTLVEHITAETAKIYKTDQSVADPSSQIKPSDVLSGVNFTAWIDRDHQLRKMTLNGTFDTSKLPSQSTTDTAVSSFSSAANFALVLTLSDYGKSLPIAAPQSSISSEQFFVKIRELMQSATPSAMPIFADPTAIY